MSTARPCQGQHAADDECTEGCLDFSASAGNPDACTCGHLKHRHADVTAHAGVHLNLAGLALVGVQAHVRSWLDKLKQACVDVHGVSCKHTYHTHITTEVLKHAVTCSDCPKEVRAVLDMSIHKSPPDPKQPKHQLFSDLYTELTSPLHNPTLQFVPSGRVVISDCLDAWEQVLLVRVVRAQGKECVILKYDGSARRATAQDAQSPNTSPLGTHVEAAAAPAPAVAASSSSRKRTRAATSAVNSDDARKRSVRLSRSDVS